MDFECVPKISAAETIFKLLAEIYTSGLLASKIGCGIIDVSESHLLYLYFISGQWQH